MKSLQIILFSSISVLLAILLMGGVYYIAPPHGFHTHGKQALEIVKTAGVGLTFLASIMAGLISIANTNSQMKSAKDNLDTQLKTQIETARENLQKQITATEANLDKQLKTANENLDKQIAAAKELETHKEQLGEQIKQFEASLSKNFEYFKANLSQEREAYRKLSEKANSLYRVVRRLVKDGGDWNEFQQAEQEMENADSSTTFVDKEFSDLWYRVWQYGRYIGRKTANQMDIPNAPPLDEFWRDHGNEFTLLHQQLKELTHKRTKS